MECYRVSLGSSNEDTREHDAYSEVSDNLTSQKLGLPNMDSFALAGEDAVPKEQVIEMLRKAHEEYDRKHGIKV